MHSRRSLRSAMRPLAGPAALALALLAGACSGDDDEASFVIRTTNHNVLVASPLTVGGLLLVYLADERFTNGAGPMGGTDLNGDGDDVDQVAVVINMASTVETVLRAAVATFVVGTDVYLVVEEVDDGMDWGGTAGTTDLVLLHWSAVAGVTTFVDALDRSSAVQAVAAGGRLYFSSATAPTAGTVETNLRYLGATDPTMPMMVLHDPGAGPMEPLSPRLIGAQDGLVALYLDETVEGRPLNGDTLADDGFVLALLDGTDESAAIESVGVALADADAPWAARSQGASDWLVGFLANEMAQGVNLNDQALFAQPLLPMGCVDDTDMDDDVLFFLDFASFRDGTSLPESTGLAGTGRVVVVDGFVATLSPEADANCDLNGDGNDDVVARWVEAVLPITPPRERSQFHAVETTLPGGSMGLATLENRLVIVVDEAQDSDDIDGKPANNDLVGWLEPAAGFTETWDFSHSSGNPNFGTGIAGEPFAGATWMAEAAQEGRLGIAFQEEVPNLNLNNNVDCALVVKDADAVDSLPVWADFEAGPTLDFDGLGYAIDEDNAGIVVARSVVFFRVDEAADNRDYNNDGMANDFVLMRNPVFSCGPFAMATASDVAGPVIVTDASRGGVFLSSEFDAGLDFNGDGDMSDLVPRYFLF